MPENVGRGKWILAGVPREGLTTGLTTMCESQGVHDLGEPRKRFAFVIPCLT